MKKKYHFTEEMDDEIKRVYQTEIGMRSKLHTGYLKRLSKKFGIPPWTISKRATKLGVLPTQKKEPDWSNHELKILEASAHLPPLRIQINLKKHGYHRTQQGIFLKRKSMRLVQGLNDYNVNSVALCFGVDPHTVKGWIKYGWLKSTKREENRYYIRRTWIKKFIVNNVEVIDFRKIDKYWLVDLLSN